ncbi:Spore cortex-lytic enzyme precursor [Roseisalinus antarcticus]|uniref:Spore cortex-lytic enzyme n=2 Tax=Roseisalinus antarcticus TaxID=254357 RepID=A0A1Y5TL81_9RHOB|nr:Spore cortex-lytic enzyme precursor [Roseisalinus antarcticus]
MTWGRTYLRTAAAAALVFSTLAVGLPGPAAAQELMAARLEALLGQERQALRVVPSNRLAALTAPPTAQATRPAGDFSYDERFVAAQPVATGGSQWRCLTEALYFEARGEDLAGLFAVGEVILNRVDDPRFPGSVCSVVNQGTGRQFACQFTYTCDGRPETVNDQRSWRRVGKVARLMIDGAPRALTEGATHYHTRAVNPNWARRFPRTTSLGVHHFYRWPLRTASN